MSPIRIEKLTPAQQAMIPQYREKWRARALSTQPVDSPSLNLNSREDTGREMLMRDPLTGVFNRRYLVELEQKLRVREKSQQLLGILMIDIDRLILYNDRFGHLEGDKILQELAILLQKSSGEKNIVIRTGGGKFVVLLPETSLEKIQELGQQIREEAKLLDLEKKKKAEIRHNNICGNGSWLCRTWIKCKGADESR